MDDGEEYARALEPYSRDMYCYYELVEPGMPSTSEETIESSRELEAFGIAEGSSLYIIHSYIILFMSCVAAWCHARYAVTPHIGVSLSGARCAFASLFARPRTYTFTGWIDEGPVHVGHVLWTSPVRLKFVSKWLYEMKMYFDAEFGNGQYSVCRIICLYYYIYILYIHYVLSVVSDGWLVLVSK